ncbi:MAG: methyltransferase domain-containing protein [bacterium]
MGGKNTKTHVDYLLSHFPDLLRFSILDIGSGRGNFLIDIGMRGGQAAGLEINDAYIKETMDKAAQKGLPVKVIKGTAENLPFEDASFDFINFALVIEHVDDPLRAVAEMSRVMKIGGQAYMGVPNRFGFWDPHFHLYLVNWLPRAWCSRFITLFGEHKDYNGPAGRQKLEDMHYFTFRKIKKILREEGIEAIDTREIKIKKFFRIGLIYWPILLIYKFYRFFFSDSFHLLLKKVR